MTRTCATGCGRPTETMLCADCVRQLVADLRALVDGGRDASGALRAGLLAELDTTAARQHVLGDPVGVRSRAAETPLPYHPAAVELRWTVDNTVTTWARDVAETNGHVAAWTSVADAAAWLARRHRELARHPAADELADEIGHVVTQVRAVIDRPRERVYLGPCETCGADLYALPQASVVDCRCGERVDVRERRDWLLDVVEQRLATASEISRALPTLVNAPVTASMVRGYAKRGRIMAQGTDQRGMPLYRIGDVIALVTRRLAVNA